MIVKLNHRIDGNGPHVLLLHAVGVDLTFLDAVATKLARDFTVLRADLRGHGNRLMRRPRVWKTMRTTCMHCALT